MKLRLAIPITIGLALVLSAVISAGSITQKAYAAVASSGTSGASGGSLGRASGVTTEAGSGQSGSNVGGVDRH